MELARAAADDPELSRQVVATFRAELGPPGVSWEAAIEMERGKQMWTQRRRQRRRCRRAGLMRFRPVPSTAAEELLRQEVRDFLAEELPRGSYRPALGFNAEHDPAFTLKLAERGWVGMAIPPQYGGGGRSPVDRFIVAEELLAAGAPVGAHWVADRQTAPALLAFGTRIPEAELPASDRRGASAISRSGCLSRMPARILRPCAPRRRKSSGGWVISGAKIWTSWAHRNHFFVALCRSSPKSDDRHAGLSQFIIDLPRPG